MTAAETPGQTINRIFEQDTLQAWTPRGAAKAFRRLPPPGR